MIKIIIITLIVTIILIGVFAISPMIAYNTDEWIDSTIVDKERVVTSDSSRYLIFGENEVLQNTDSFWYWKWDSSDFYRDLEVGKTYRLRVYGFRIGFLSWHRNIIDFEEVK